LHAACRLGWFDFHGEHVVPAGGDDQRRGVVLGVHGIDGDHHLVQVEQARKVTHSRDLVALDCGGDLTEHGAGGVVERRDQVRRCPAQGAGTGAWSCRPGR